MDESNMEKSALACHLGLFQFNVMPFGWPLHRQFFLEGIDKFIVACLDDILIYCATLKENLVHIQQVSDTLRKHSLSLKLNKFRLK